MAQVKTSFVSLVSRPGLNRQYPNRERCELRDGQSRNKAVGGLVVDSERSKLRLACRSQGGLGGQRLQLAGPCSLEPAPSLDPGGGRSASVKKSTDVGLL